MYSTRPPSLILNLNLKLRKKKKKCAYMKRHFIPEMFEEGLFFFQHFRSNSFHFSLSRLLFFFPTS